MESEKGDVDVIEKYVLFATEVKVNVKVRKTTSHGNQSEYVLAEIAGVAIESISFDMTAKIDILKKIKEEAFVAVKKYEEKCSDD